MRHKLNWCEYTIVDLIWVSIASSKIVIERPVGRPYVRRNSFTLIICEFRGTTLLSKLPAALVAGRVARVVGLGPCLAGRELVHVVEPVVLDVNEILLQ